MTTTEQLELRHKQYDLAIQSKKIVERAEKAGRDITDEEAAKINRMMDEIDKIGVDLKAAGLESDGYLEDLQLPSLGRQTSPQPIAPQNGRMTGGGTPMFRNVATGEPINGYAHSQRISQANDVSLGAVARSMILNDWSDVSHDLRAAVTSGADSSGGYMVDSYLSRMFIDLARSASVVSRAGAISVPIAGETKIGTLESDPSVQWRGETVTVQSSTPSFGSIILRPKTASAIIPVSIEWLEDAQNSEMVLENALRAAMGSAIDQAALTGTGAASQPLGIVNNPNVLSTAAVGTPTDYSDISSAVGSLYGANYPGEVSSLSWVLNPVVGTIYDQLVTGLTGDASPLQPTPWVAQLQKMFTTSLAANASSEYQQIVGDFSQVLLGMRTNGMTLQVLTSGSATDSAGVTYNAASDLMVLFRIYVRLDVALLRPSWMHVLSGTTIV